MAKGMRGTRGRILVAAAACLVLWYAFLVFAYNPFQDQMTFNDANVTVPARWPNATITWDLNPSVVGSNVTTTGGTDIPTTLQNAFTPWNTTQLNGQLLTNLVITRGSNTTLTDPVDNDCNNVISFVPSSSVTFPTGAIAFTEVATVTLAPAEPDTTSGCGYTNATSVPVSFLSNADMVFNPKQSFSTTTPPLANHFDVQSVAAHEFGHALGLDHSGIAHTIMFPFGDTTATGQQRTLAVDDVVGIGFLYPGPNFATATGTMSGKITLDSKGIFASHVVAVDATTGAAVVDGLSNPDGTYKLVGVPPSSYNVLALPLGDPKDVNAVLYTLDDFSGWACGYGENSPPCCDPNNPPNNPNCKGTPVPQPTNYSGKFF
jgi:hypothetical protein